ncbi:MAG: hypothetical protein ACRD3D_17590 [Terriglobia bacterium]
MGLFLGALFSVCAGTLMYEIVLTRLLSAVCWYYLAFVSISMAMFGMTVGALAVQLRPDFFSERQIAKRLGQASFAMAVSMPLALLTMLAVPIDISYSAETVYSFVLFSAIIAVPFFFSGVVVCLSLTKTPFPVGRIYFSDLAGAAFGCAASVALLDLIDAPSGIFVISAILFCGAALYAAYGGDSLKRRRSLLGAGLMLALALANASTLHGIQPIWSKGHLDPRSDLFAEIWNPISKVRVRNPQTQAPQMWGPSPRTPHTQVIQMGIDIDNDAETPLMRFDGDLGKFDFLNYDVSSLGAQLRKGGSAAIIGVGGGRDVLTAAVNGFHRIVGIEVNRTIVNLTRKRLIGFSGFDKIPGFELHNDEGRSYLTRSREKFDLIQASLVDTWAATSAGAMTLTENALYTVNGWQIFYDHLKPGGIITFSRWDIGSRKVETYRLFSVAWATLLSRGVGDPAAHVALVKSGGVATLLVSNRPFSANDLRTLRSIVRNKEFTALYLPGERPAVPELDPIMASRSLRDLARLRGEGPYDYSPVFDSSPYFFNSVHLHSVPAILSAEGFTNANLRALFFVLCFALAALILVALTIILPLTRWQRARAAPAQAPAGGIIYFVAIGLGFMLAEMSMMQQLSIFLGEPVYSLVVVLAGLILSAGIGSLVSDRLRLASGASARSPSIAAVIVLVAYAAVVLPVIHRFVAGFLWERVALSLLLVAPCGFLMGFCFPVGLRWMAKLAREDSLPWMWALNGAAATLATFAAMFISMETSIETCVIAAAACYAVAAAFLPRKSGAADDLRSSATSLAIQAARAGESLRPFG